MKNTRNFVCFLFQFSFPHNYYTNYTCWGNLWAMCDCTCATCCCWLDSLCTTLYMHVHSLKWVKRNHTFNDNLNNYFWYSKTKNILNNFFINTVFKYCYRLKIIMFCIYEVIHLFHQAEWQKLHESSSGILQGVPHFLGEHLQSQVLQFSKQ